MIGERDSRLTVIASFNTFMPRQFPRNETNSSPRREFYTAWFISEPWQSQNISHASWLPLSLVKVMGPQKHRKETTDTLLNRMPAVDRLIEDAFNHAVVVIHLPCWRRMAIASLSASRMHVESLAPFTLPFMPFNHRQTFR